MHDERTGRTPESASVEMRWRLEAGLVRARLNKSQLAGQAGLSRGTVQEAFKAGGKVPSTFTMAALARVLKLPTGEMQELRRDAAGGVRGDGPGRPIAQWEPHALEVHPAGPAPGGAGLVEQRVLPGYVRREHDRLLAEAVRRPRRVVAGCWYWSASPRRARPGPAGRLCSRSRRRGGGCGIPSIRPARKPRWKNCTRSGRGRRPRSAHRAGAGAGAGAGLGHALARVLQGVHSFVCG